MDTHKLHDLIDKVIGKEGPLRTPAYWMRKVFRDMIDKSESDISKLRNEVGLRLGQKLSSLQDYTYRELFDMAISGKLVEGQQYKLIDYEPIISYRAIWSNIYDYSLTGSSNWRSKFGGIILTAISNNTFSQNAVYLYLNEGKSYESKPCEFFFASTRDKSYDNYTYCREESEYDTFEGLDSWGNSHKLVFISDNINGIRYKEVETQESYFVNGVNKSYTSSYGKLDAVVLRKEVNGDPLTLTVTDFTFRVKGAVTRLIEEGVFDICYDALAFRPSLHLEESRNLIIKGSFHGDAYFPYISFSSPVFNTHFIDCSDITISSSIETPEGISSPSRVSVVNSKFERCESISLGYAKDATMVGCSSVSSSYGVINAKFFYSNTLKLKATYGACYFVDNKMLKLSNVLTKSSLSNVIQDIDGNDFFPKTLASLVTDEATGKTLDILLNEMDALGKDCDAKIADIQEILEALEDHTHTTYTTPNDVRDIVENVIDEALSVVINTPL